MFFREGNQVTIGSAISTHSGSTWSAPTQLFDDTTGRPAVAGLSTGTMAVVARRISDRQAIVRSRNSGTVQTAWLPARRQLLFAEGSRRPTAPCGRGGWSARLRMVLRDRVVQGYANGWPLVGYELALGTEANTFAGQARHGIKLNPAGAGVHRCRRFVAKS